MTRNSKRSFAPLALAAVVLALAVSPIRADEPASLEDAAVLSPANQAALVMSILFSPPLFPAADPTPVVDPPPPLELPPGLPPVDPVDPVDPGPVPGHMPEPASLITGLVGFGLAGLYAAYRRKRK
jgi:hypothetical protein